MLAALSNCMKLAYCIILIFIVACTPVSYKIADLEIVNEFEVEPDEILLVVKVIDSRFTDYYNYECDEGCIPFYFWFVHTAEVLEVIDGKYKAKKIVFANMQHTNFIKEVTDEWYVKVARFTDQETIEVLRADYVLRAHSAKYFHEEE